MGVFKQHSSLFFVCLFVLCTRTGFASGLEWPEIALLVSSCDVQKGSPNLFSCVSNTWVTQCLWEKFLMSSPDTMQKLSRLFWVILQRHSIFSFRCIVFNMISAMMKWNTLFSHVAMFTEPDINWMQEHLPVRFLLVCNMDSICYYYYMKLYAYDKIIYLCLLHALVNWSLNGTDHGQFCQTELGATSLLFLWLAPQTWHSWWPYAFVSMPSSCFPAVVLNIV